MQTVQGYGTETSCRYPAPMVDACLDAKVRTSEDPGTNGRKIGHPRTVAERLAAVSDNVIHILLPHYVSLSPGS